MNWFSKLFSVDELRASALVLCLIATTATSIISFFMLGDIPSALIGLVNTFAIAVGSVAGVSIAKDAIAGKVTNTTNSTNINNYTQTTSQLSSSSSQNNIKT
jgi:hypothetical protein